MARTPIPIMEELMPEGIPATGIYQSFNGSVWLGGYEIMRVSNATIRVSTGVSKYQEVGSRYGTPYRRETRASLSITRAFVNFYEALLSIGFLPDADFRPGEVYVEASKNTGEGRNLADLLAKITDDSIIGMGSDLANRPPNRYPIKTQASFVVNKDHLQPMDQTVGDGDSAVTIDNSGKAYEQILTVHGVMINMNQLAIGAGGDIITSGPIDGLGEAVTWGLLEIDH